jgi:PAS domain S-box-containing protein
MCRMLVPAVRRRPELASTHVVVAAALDSPDELRAALNAGADDVMRVPFEPEVLGARVAAGLRAARLRANEALLRSLVDNIPGALYRCAWDSDWTMRWLSDEIETITGYPAHDFMNNSARTFASVIHPDDRAEVERSVMKGVHECRPYNLEYRIVRRDGETRWVLERGQAQDAGDGRRWLGGAIFDITVRRAAEHALREREVVQAQLAEVRASRARIVDAADRARREIERNLHDGAQQRFVSATLQLQVWRASHGELPQQARAELDQVLTELRAGLAELRELAHGLHPAVLSDRGLERALPRLAVRQPRAVFEGDRESRGTINTIVTGRRGDAGDELDRLGPIGTRAQPVGGWRCELDTSAVMPPRRGTTVVRGSHPENPAITTDRITPGARHRRSCALVLRPLDQSERGGLPRGRAPGVRGADTPRRRRTRRYGGS